MSESLTILAIGDVHYASRDDAASARLNFPTSLGLEWLWRAVEEARRLCHPDVIVLLGDLLENGRSPEAEADLSAMVTLLRETNLPLIAVPGNHDAYPERLLEFFGDSAGAHPVNGYTLYSFADPFAADESMVRPPEEIERFLAAELPGPLIVLQHSPIFPDVPSDEYPYMPRNVEAIRDSYRRKNAVLSLSGHYHDGQGAVTRDGVTYVTVGALCKTPYRFDIVRVEGEKVCVERRQLRLPVGASVADCHVHTHFGYCAVNVHPTPVLERSQLLGARGVVCVEHAGQLYLSEEDFWNKRHVDDPQSLRSARSAGVDRIGAFRDAMAEFRSDALRVGLEAELDRDGNLTLLEEDREGWDLLLGAVHWLPTGVTPSLEEFLKTTERVIASGIHVLAHPFRYAYQKRLPLDEAAYRRVAAALKRHNVLAEVNYHYNAPASEFYRICVEEGVRLIFGSDAHMLREVCDFTRHVRLLESLNTPLDRLADPFA